MFRAKKEGISLVGLEEDIPDTNVNPDSIKLHPEKCVESKQIAHEVTVRLS